MASMLAAAPAGAMAAPANARSADIAASADLAATHLERGLAYFAAGHYAEARIEFETVLRRDDRPASLYQQAELYAEAARAYLAGVPLQASGYVLGGVGRYRENDTVAGRGSIDDMFVSGRAGGRVNLKLSGTATINASLDYRYRNYDNAGRHDDSDLRWDGNVSHAIGDNNLAVGVRGWISARGDGRTRNDYGVFTEFRTLADRDNQFQLGFEVRRRDYPFGPLRYRTRNIVDLTGGWTRSLAGGRASFSLSGGLGREFATDQRPDGDSSFFNLSPALDVTFTEALGGHVFAWWQRARYNLERTDAINADLITTIPTRSDNLWEVGGGLSWVFAKGWSINPEMLYIKEDSNLLAVNYSATEFHLTLRKDF